jgi:transposase-like protein
MATQDPIPDQTPPTCPLCGAPMTLLAKLPSIDLRPELQTFRCTNCRPIEGREVT